MTLHFPQCAIADIQSYPVGLSQRNDVYHLPIRLHRCCLEKIMSQFDLPDSNGCDPQNIASHGVPGRTRVVHEVTSWNSCCIVLLCIVDDGCPPSAATTSCSPCLLELVANGHCKVCPVHTQ